MEARLNIQPSDVGGTSTPTEALRAAFGGGNRAYARMTWGGIRRDGSNGETVWMREGHMKEWMERRE